MLFSRPYELVDKKNPVLELDCPGYKKTDIKVTFNGRTGELRVETKNEKRGRAVTSYVLGDHFEGVSKSCLEDGVLKIFLKVAKEAEDEVIPVE